MVRYGLKQAESCERVRAESTLVILLTALLIVGAVALSTVRYHGRDYRADEVNTVHAGVVLNASEVVSWMGANGVHPAGWRVLGVYWVKLTGVTESATRWLSALCTMLTLALVYRLAADLFDRRTGLAALFLLGTAPFFIFYMREFRPYALLALTSAGLLLSFVRWLRRPTFARALLFVAFGVIALQTHYFAAYILVGQALAFVVLVRWERGRYLRAFGLFAAIALSFTAWLLPILHRFMARGGKTYASPSDWDTLALIHDELQIAPLALGQLLLIAALLLPVGAWGKWRGEGAIFRGGPEWRKRYVLLVPLIALATAFVANIWISSITTRNLIGLLPPLAVLLAFALRRMPWQAQVALVALVALPALKDFRAYRESVPYKATVAFVAPNYQPDDHFLVSGLKEPRELAYYFFDRLKPRPQNGNMYFVGYLTQESAQAEHLQHRVFTPEPEYLAEFADFLADAGRVWYIYGDEQLILRNVGPFLDVLHQEFALHRAEKVLGDRRAYHLREYRRIPDDLRDAAHFGEAISLQGWHLPDGVSVRACQDVPFESWWRALDAPSADLGIGLVLADASGQGVAKADAGPSGARTIGWAAGTYHLDGRALAVPCDLPPGDYSLLIGLHDLVTAEALPAFAPDGVPTGSNLVYLTTLRVLP
ncbi:MAG: glycosyltransferase family 39 protein [Anaerolineae bacterium]|nr:glycosyltransferase family 39 protein [Anaerolineae bacterium]